MSMFKSFNLKYYGSYCIWALWIVFVIWVSYKCRFWINNDTIGSLDSAKHIKNYEIISAINAYWGVGYALLLSIMPLGQMASWFYIHLLIALLIIATQIILYSALIQFNVRKWVALMLCMIWGGSNFATGSALYLSADVLLCFIGSIYIMYATRYNDYRTIVDYHNSLLLGTIHAIAWMTKMVALLALCVFPIVIIIKSIFCERDIPFMRKMRGLISFAIFYSFPIVVIGLIWMVGTKAKYGRFTLGDTASYNYELYISQSETLKNSIDQARYAMPAWGTFWWSDISSNLISWDFAPHYNIRKQINRIKSNLNLSHIEILNGIIPLSIIIFASFYSILFLIKNQCAETWAMLASISLCTVLLYLSSNFYCRFFPFAEIFALPAFGVMIEKNLQNSKKLFKILSVMFIGVALFQGTGSMVYSAIFLAPGNEHFIIADEMRKGGEKKSYGPIGYFDTLDTWYHHGIIGFILGAKAAEIKKVNRDQYTANFQPKIILLALSPNQSASELITVNSIQYRITGIKMWRNNSEKLVTYEVLNEDKQ